MREETERPDGDDADELRALERAAYGPDGGLDAAGARRLRELQDERRRRTAAPIADAGTPVPPPPATAAREDEDAAAPGSALAIAPSPPESAPAVAVARRPRILPVLGAAGALLAIGLGAGWALFAPRAETPSLTPAQEQRRAGLAEDYDPGSVRAVAEGEGALAWYASQDDGDTRCLILDVGEDSQSTCLPRDEVAPGLYASVPVAGTTSADEEDAYAVDSVTATMVFSTTDEPMVSIQRWGSSSALVDQFGAAQRPRAEELIEDGYTLGLTLLGSFREQPVWLGDRPVDEGPVQRCLIVDVDGSRQCTALADAIDAGLGVQVVDIAQETGEVLSVSVIEVAFTRWQVPYLTVTTASATATSASGDSFLVTTGPPGDPIRVDIPGRDPDG
ncbi:hypothetical protein [Microbacterium sp. BLY]|uniref:hypothetical protein n=1 Tax=Microbacterium sp. BLY TaxID=2823280 RepID=UPI001B31E784|nr:hypothetical protein [Microbacterium sp. BLY]MBP3977643.1 hypothetical protein [Microbacterium sp. BLY]